MKYNRVAVLLSFILFFFGCAKPPVQAPQLHQRPAGFWENEKAVVQVFHFYFFIPVDLNGMPILGPDGQPAIYQQMGIGTGGVLDVNGLVITNNHVVTAQPVDGQLILNFPPYTDIYTVCTVTEGVRECVAGEVVFTDPVHDLALIYTDQEFSQAITLADDDPESGEDLYFWGNVGFLLPPSPFFGHYTGLIGPPYVTQDKSYYPLPMMMMDINVSRGSSGAPVFDEEGKCIGIAFSYPDADTLGSRSLPYIIPLSTVREFLSTWAYQR